MGVNFKQQALDFERIEKAIQFVESYYHQQPELDAIAAHIGISEYHFQRLFKRWVGISPKRFLQFITKENAKKLLLKSENLLEVAFKTGLSGSGRLHDLFVNCEAMTPGEYKEQGAGLHIYFGYHMTPFGECLIGVTDRGICGIYFIHQGNREHYFRILQETWPQAELINNSKHTQPVVEAIFNPETWSKSNPFQLYIHGTNFQIKVWEALLQIPEGMVLAYEDIAAQIGSPNAVRAVGSAVARNPISYLIPCHRVIRKIGEFGNYQGGPARKKALLAWESARQDSGVVYGVGN
jgi:AraC family transcriptional regulator of adaptative response/methylated-DNA-[protein]-cysteine methyltransferase